MNKLKKVIIMLMVLSIGFVITSVKASEIENERSEASVVEPVVDLSGLSPDQIARKLDQSEKTQDFIVLNQGQLAQLKGYTVTEVVAKEDFSNVNSTMWGQYGVYKIDGHFVFCIEPGYDTLNTANKVNESGSIYGKFAESSKTYITRVISSAVSNYERSDNDAYIFAGQLLIWDYVSSNEADVIGNAMASWNPNYLTSWTISNSVYLPQIKEIEKELDSWMTLPSFLGTSSATAKGYELKYDEEADQFAITLKDTNGVWDQKYAKYQKVGNYTLSNPSGKDNVKISTPTEQLGYSDVQKFTWEPAISSTKELYDAGQDLIYVGAKPVNGYIKFKTAAYPKGGFELEKVGEQENGEQSALGGVKFKVTGDGFEKIYTTDDKGMIRVTNQLKPGNYHIQEITAPSRYQVDFEQDFKVEPGKVTKINDGKPIVNKLYYNRITFSKYGQNFDNNDSQQYPLSGVEFELYKEGGEANQVIDGDDQLIATLVSNEAGIVVSDRLYEGNYIIKESKTLPGYVLLDQTYSFEVTNDGRISNGATIDLGVVSNQVITGKVELEKIGVGACPKVADCSVPLADVSFEVYSDLNGDLELNDDELSPVMTITTDEDGRGQSEPLKYGHYFLKEVDNPHENYNLTETVYQFTIDQADQVVQVNEGNPIQNSEKTGTLEIEKRAESSGDDNGDIHFLNGAKYQVVDEAGDPIAELTTDQDGRASVSNLSFGKYQIYETEAPTGYVLDPTIYEFEVGVDNYQAPIMLEFSDRAIKNTIEISKVDAANDQELSGAELVVIDKNTDQQVQAWTSTTEPYRFEIDYGDYQICETLAPPGFKRATTCTDFKVAEDGVTQSFKIVNKRMKMAITGSSSRRTWVLILLVIILIILSVLYIRIYVKNIKL